jgi:hypothetical protein
VGALSREHTQESETIGLDTNFGEYHIHCCLKCFDNKNVLVASSDAEIYSVVQGDKKTTDRPLPKKNWLR